MVCGGIVWSLLAVNYQRKPIDFHANTFYASRESDLSLRIDSAFLPCREKEASVLFVSSESRRRRWLSILFMCVLEKASICSPLLQKSFGESKKLRRVEGRQRSDLVRHVLSQCPNPRPNRPSPQSMKRNAVPLQNPSV